MGDAILTLNEGSSSVKFALFRANGGEPALLCRGAVTGLGDRAQFRARDAAGVVLGDQALDSPSQAAALKFLLSWLERRFGDRLMAAGHRVVHGGLQFTSPVRIDDDVMHAGGDLGGDLAEFGAGHFDGTGDVVEHRPFR